MSGTKGVFLKKKAIYKSSPELKEHFTSKENLIVKLPLESQIFKHLSSTPD